MDTGWLKAISFTIKMIDQNSLYIKIKKEKRINKNNVCQMSKFSNYLFWISIIFKINIIHRQYK